MKEASDAELIRQIQTQRSSTAMTILYERYLPAVYRYFYARTHNVQQAEDLTAQTFMVVIEGGMAHYQERGTFAGWLFSIAARRLTDQLRKPMLTTEIETSEVMDYVRDTEPLPEHIVLKSERYRHLQEALQTLSPDRKQAVALHFFGGLSYQETAQVMKRSKIAVKSLVNRALRDLRKRLDHAKA